MWVLLPLTRMFWRWPNRRIFLYLLSELIPSFLLGVFVFIFILLMFQALRLTEFLLVHGVSQATLLKIVLYMSISFLPALLPMSLLFSVLMTYIRFSSDSEIVAMKALGSSTKDLITPAFAMGTLIAVISFYTSFFVGPWGNRQFELIINDISQKKAGATIREGSFSEGFFDMVVYANKADSKTGYLQKVFIYDERDRDNPMTIIAKEGRFLQKDNTIGSLAFLKLFNGSFHRSDATNSTIINFESYDLNLSNTSSYSHKQKSLPSLNYKDLRRHITKPLMPKPREDTKLKQWKKAKLKKDLYIFEFHKRLAIALACVLFALLGVSIGMKSNKRSTKSSGFVLSLGIIVSYWVLFVASDNLVKSEILSPILGGWFASLLFSIFCFRKLKKI